MAMSEKQLANTVMESISYTRFDSTQFAHAIEEYPEWEQQYLFRVIRFLIRNWAEQIISRKMGFENICTPSSEKEILALSEIIKRETLSKS